MITTIITHYDYLYVNPVIMILFIPNKSSEGFSDKLANSLGGIGTVEKNKNVDR